LTLTYDLDFQSLAIYGHDPHNTETQVQTSVGSKEKQTDGQTDASDFFTFPANR